MRRFLLTGVALLALGGVARADVVITPSGTVGDTSQGSPAPAGTGTPTPFGPAGGGGQSDSAGNPVPLYTFNVPFTGNVTVSIQDCCLVGDVFQLAVDGSFLGQSAIVPIGGSTNSTGSFTLSLAAGTHTLGIEDITQSYEGATTGGYGNGGSPFGVWDPTCDGGLGCAEPGPVPGGVGPDNTEYDPAGFTYGITEATPSNPTPEPVSAALLGAGLVGLSVVRRRRKK